MGDIKEDQSDSAREEPSIQLGEVYRDLLSWASTLPRWQQELVRRLLRSGALSASDVADLATAAVNEAEQQATTFAQLSSADLPSVAQVEPRRTLVGIRALQNINALRSDQELMFGPQLTVVYGDNGSGKSGYGRVLKRVYRARAVEDILGDVRSDVVSVGGPSATFLVAEADGTERAIPWSDGTPTMGIGRFAVLDAGCSLTYLRAGALGVGPAGIDVPGRFADELDRVKQHLAERARLTLPVKGALKRLENETAIGRLVAGLSASTIDAELSAASVWTPEDAQEALSLDRAIAEARAHSPSARRARLQSRLNALEAIGKRLVTWNAAVEQVNELMLAVAAVAEAERAVRAVQALADSDAPSKTAPGKTWEGLLRAANAYVESFVGSDHKLEPMSIDGRCALCRQHLDDAAATRLQSFKAHLEGAAVRASGDARQRLEGLMTRLRGIPDAVSPEDVAVLSSEGALAGRVSGLVSVLAARRRSLIALVEVSTPLGEMPVADATVVPAIRSVWSATKAELALLPLDDTSARAELGRLNARRLELTTRQGLSALADDARAFVAGMRIHQRLQSAGAGINTRAASAKAAELSTRHVTDRYTKLVEDELVELRFRRPIPTLLSRTNKAKVEITPLVSADLKHIPAERVFSEGEKTTISLACFLAELRLGDDPSGLIFDDPISSLDHGVREHVARRLVRAARDRQVIVFTHDLAFLADLREQSKKILNVECEFRTLTALGQAGIVESEEPFGARSVSKRVRALRERLTSIARSHKDGDIVAFRAQGREFYEHLRSTWERYIEEHLFAGVVQRLERNVTPGALARVVFTHELGEKVHEGWRRCSNVLEAHDHAPSAGAQVYSIEDMRADFKHLEDAPKLT